MKYFIDEHGKITDVGTDHVIYAKRVMKSSLKLKLNKMVRVQIYNRFFSFETTQEKLTDSQRSALRKLYKNHSCVGYTGRVRSLGYCSPDDECVKTISFGKFGV
ncbi:MAG: hypothetical protein FVQ80_11225 [Planctomycetes bacterium]|nr:hypothetical protein [Planctomycetota bacterium]